MFVSASGRLKTWTRLFKETTNYFNTQHPDFHLCLFQWNFQIHKQFFVELHFVHIYFAWVSSRCDVAGLLIFNKGVIVKYGQFQICSTQSAFSFYPGFHTPQIRTYVSIKHPVVRYHSVDVLFQVMDSGIFKSFQQIYVNFLQTQPPFSIYFFKRNISEHTMIIQTNKSMTPVINVTSCVPIIVHDGPDASFEEIFSDNTFYFVSTFQCTLRYQSTIFRKNGILNYHGQSLVIQKYTEIDMNKSLSFALPQTFCKEMSCVCHISAPSGWQVNITVLQLTYTGHFSEYCKYGGVFAFEIDNRNLHESVMHCNNISSNLSQSKSFYSVNGALALSLIWYKTMSKISGTFIVSLTECKGKYWCPCKWAHEHSSRKIIKWSVEYVYSSKCSFRNEFQKLVQVVEISTLDCVIMQVHSVDYLKWCPVEIKHKFSPHFNVQTNYTIIGSLQPILLDTSLQFHQLAVFGMNILNQVDLFGIYDKICFQNLTFKGQKVYGQTDLICRHQVAGTHKFIDGSIQRFAAFALNPGEHHLKAGDRKNDIGTGFYLFVSFSTPFSPDVNYLKFQPSTNSWMDIIITNRVREKPFRSCQTIQLPEEKVCLV